MCDVIVYNARFEGTEHCGRGVGGRECEWAGCRVRLSVWSVARGPVAQRQRSIPRRLCAVVCGQYTLSACGYRNASYIKTGTLFIQSYRDTLRFGTRAGSRGVRRGARLNAREARRDQEARPSRRNDSLAVRCPGPWLAASRRHRGSAAAHRRPCHPCRPCDARCRRPLRRLRPLSRAHLPLLAGPLHLSAQADTAAVNHLIQCASIRSTLCSVRP